MNTIIDTLPDTLHGLLRIAIDDLREVSRRRDVVVNMQCWLVVRDSVCTVCMAGAVMLNTLKVDRTSSCFDFVDPLSQKFRAINQLRQGQVMYAFRALYPDRSPTPLIDRPVHDYYTYEEEFFEDMERLYDNLTKLEI